MIPLPARSNAEAHLYIELHPCGVCGEIRFPAQMSTVVVDGGLATRYSGACVGCATAREFLFWLPEEDFPDEDEPSFGDDRPSELVDPGEWLWLADLVTESVPADPGEMTAQQRRQARFDLRTAAAAVAEAAKFVPDDADAVPAECVRSARGRALYDEDPGRFRRRRLTAMHTALRELAERFVG